MGDFNRLKVTGGTKYLTIFYLSFKSAKTNGIFRCKINLFKVNFTHITMLVSYEVCQRSQTSVKRYEITHNPHSYENDHTNNITHLLNCYQKPITLFTSQGVQYINPGFHVEAFYILLAAVPSVSRGK